MGEIAEMMLDGTMDCETGEWNFDGEDGPGYPMTGAEAAAYKRDVLRYRTPEEPRYRLTKAWRRKIEAFGAVTNNDAYHWQVRADGRVIADWWPHKRKYRIGGKTMHGYEPDFVKALAKLAKATGEA